jgi:hypothetical protein
MGKFASWQGLDRLRRKLKGIPTACEDAVVDALPNEARALVASQQAAAPKKSGDLARSIKWRWGVPKEFRDARGGGNRRLSIVVSAGDAKAFYARWVEFSTQPRENTGQFPGTKHPGTPGQPYFFPPYRARKPGIKNRLKSKVRRAARRAVKGSGA